MRATRAIPALLSAVFLAGCAGPIAEQAFEEVAAATRATTGSAPAWIRGEEDLASARTAVAALLAKPLGPDDAVSVAMLANRGLQGRLSDLGIGAAALSRARRPENPGFSFSRLKRGDDVEIERGITVDALSLLVLPIAAGIEERRFESTRLAVANDVLALAAATRRSWYEAVAAAQAAGLARRVHENAEAQLELARRMRAAGNWGALDLLRVELMTGEASAALAGADAAATAARARLDRRLGLWGEEAGYMLPDSLPPLPDQPRPFDGLEAAALAGRLDLRMARAEMDGLSRSFQLTRATRFINVLETGLASNSESGLPTQKGYEISLEVPLFDFGDAKATAAEHAWLKAVHRVAETATAVRSEAREAWLAYRSAYDIARHRREHIVPLRRRVTEEMVLRYNGMLASVFDLLAEHRAEAASEAAAIEAERNFWLADTDLAFIAVAAAESGGRPPATAAMAGGGSAGH